MAYLPKPEPKPHCTSTRNIFQEDKVWGIINACRKYKSRLIIMVSVITTDYMQVNMSHVYVHHINHYNTGSHAL